MDQLVRRSETGAGSPPTARCAVDMESARLAAAAGERPVAVVRAISDTAESAAA